MSATAPPLITVDKVGKLYGHRHACRNVSFALGVGEILGIVGESGSGKSTLLRCISGRMEPSEGCILYRRDGIGAQSIYDLPEAERRLLTRTDWAFVHQSPCDGLRMNVSAGANVGERLVANGRRRYSDIRSIAQDWLERVEIQEDRIDDLPATYSDGMKQRLQIARNLSVLPRVVFMDEPTGGLDASVQARVLDLVRSLAAELKLAIIIVTHDLAVVRLLSHRLLVMKEGEVLESGLTDQVLDDPQHPYTQLLVSCTLAG